MAPRTVLPPLGAALVPGAPSSFSRKHATSLTWGGGQEPGLRPRVWGARCSDSQREAAWPPHLSSSRLQHGNGLVAHRASRAGGCRAGVPRRRGAAGHGAWRTPPTPRRRRRTPQQVVVLPSRSDFAFAPERERRSGKRVSVAAAPTSRPRPRTRDRAPRAGFPCCQSREGGGVGSFLHLPLGRRHSDRDTLSSEFKSVPESS